MPRQNVSTSEIDMTVTRAATILSWHMNHGISRTSTDHANQIVKFDDRWQGNFEHRDSSIALKLDFSQEGLSL